jgi:hypothetical protein
MRTNRKGTDGTGRDIPTVYVPSRPAVPPLAARDIGGHGGTLSRLSRLSRIEYPALPDVEASYLGSAWGSEPAQEAA